jgi:hypothetical protein
VYYFETHSHPLIRPRFFGNFIYFYEVQVTCLQPLSTSRVKWHQLIIISEEHGCYSSVSMIKHCEQSQLLRRVNWTRVWERQRS